ncbi:hypothetical protein ABA45_13535 [Marinobacter psychrophilus]|jgi:type VI secretion system secreted protein VgrG|uniref:Uncharacterized protein n=1 Tax=Marinobacter psychrophilus TaxID=330734 RepID=A0A0H4IEB7_9GAMM|nr:hypothetical protein ABA45_13535 [Marinobacter psychrophilus]
MHQANGLQFTARVGELPEDVFSLVGFELTEGLSELVHGRLKMASNLPTLAATDILEQRLELTIWQNGRIFQSQSTNNILRSLIRERDIADAVFDLLRQSAAHPPQQ